MTDVKLDLFADPDMHLFVENNIRGGLSLISNRYAKANNSYTENGLDATQDPSYVCYLVANNLYDFAMSHPLPTGNFRFLLTEEINDLDVTNVRDDDPLATYWRWTSTIHQVSTNSTIIIH